MVAGRVSSAIAAELATMKVTEQIDALTTLATDPMKYLVAPRIIITTRFLPVLTAIRNIIGIYGGVCCSPSPNSALKENDSCPNQWKQLTL